MINFSEDLNPEQLAVVQNGDGPCLVLAGAGSGKTRTITYRVAYLLEKGVKPEEILLVTFTNKAAEAMKSRVAKLIGNIHPIPWSGTFHHIGYRLLRIHALSIGYKNNFTVLDSDDSRSLIKLCVKEIKPDGAEKFPSANVIHNIISFARNAERSIADVIEDRFSLWTRILDEIAAIDKLYDQKKRESNAMDFDDLLVRTKDLLTIPEINKKYAAQFKYVLVDEYQDTNVVQAAIIRLLASIHQNIVVVGDDAQSIYSFRAATIENILGFEKEYLNAKTFKLETNYRSVNPILALANNVIANNVHQYQKKLHAVIQGIVLPILQPQIDQQSEGVWVADKIESLLAEGVAPDEIAVLFRAAAHSQMLEVELVRRNIPYDYRGGVRFFERAHIKDVLAYLRILSNTQDTAAWQRVLLHEEGIGPAAAAKVIAAVKNVTITEIESVGYNLLGEKAKLGWARFVQIWQGMTRSSTLAPGPLIRALLATPYHEYLETEFVDYKDRLQDIKQLAVFAERYDNVETFVAEATLQESFRNITNDSPATPYPPDFATAKPLRAGSLPPTPSPGKIVLSTIHQAKGLEWNSVFILNLASGAFPSDRALKEQSGLEEERRLFYVAITRAKERLFLTYPMSLSHQGYGGQGSYGDSLSGPSQFLGEINPALLDDRSLLSFNSTVLNDYSAGVTYELEDGAPFRSLPKIQPGSFLQSLEDL